MNFNYQGVSTVLSFKFITFKKAEEMELVEVVLNFSLCMS